MTMTSCRLYDRKNERLVELRRKEGKAFWEDLWGGFDLREHVMGGSRHWFIRSMTRKYLPSGARVLDAGCGSGCIVYGLKAWGYDAYGIDYAENTIKKVLDVFPDLKVKIGDVRKLSYPAEFFDGYWSLGVIEHFYDGFDEIVKEAQRVLKPGGVFFVTFPEFNLLRRIRARLGAYRIFEERCLVDEKFYQFYLSPITVIRRIREFGFERQWQGSFDATRGLSEDSGMVRHFFRNVYHSSSLLARGVRALNHILFSSFAGHSAVVVFRKV